MPACKGTDRGGPVTPRESGPTSLWSGVTREPGQQTSRGDAEMSAAATLAGAALNLGDRVCLLQVGIVKVSSSKWRRPESCATRPPRGTIRLLGGLELPHGRLGRNGTPRLNRVGPLAPRR